ncbi:hypothetical protein INR49_003856 [Caranx melampygus]|nr:hypothetical protein INR49_003856 [Caranx melampygus]
MRMSALLWLVMTCRGLQVDTLDRLPTTTLQQERQRRCSHRRCTRGMGRPHPADNARLNQSVLGRRLGKGRLQGVYPFLHAALSRSCVTLPHHTHLLGVFFPLLLILRSSIQIIIKGNDVEVLRGRTGSGSEAPSTRGVKPGTTAVAVLISRSRLLTP